MHYLCSCCHTAIEAEPEDEHKVCPSCKAEAGIEPVKDKAPMAMQYFGLILLVAAIMAVGGAVLGLSS